MVIESKAKAWVIKSSVRDKKHSNELLKIDKMSLTRNCIKVNINNLKTKKEVLQWYVDMNAGGTPHTNDEIERVRKMISEL